MMKVADIKNIGAFLIDEEYGRILLPYKFMPKGLRADDEVEVFIYRDSEDRIIATTQEPLIEVGQFAALNAKETSKIGAFFDWGIEAKDLLVPFSEQVERVQANKKYVVFAYLDEATNRIIGSTKWYKFLDKSHPELRKGEKVDCLIVERVEIGYKVIVENKYRGIIYSSDTFKRRLNYGEKVNAYVAKVRADDKIDLNLKPIGYHSEVAKTSELILKKLYENDGKMEISDKTPAEIIYQEFNMSKKAFKKALGLLYKQRKIKLGKNFIALNEK